jgi:hypothetical protein
MEFVPEYQIQHCTAPLSQPLTFGTVSTGDDITLMLCVCFIHNRTVATNLPHCNDDDNDDNDQL